MSAGGRGRFPWFRPHWVDAITLTGIVLMVHEALRAGPERPGFQFAFLAMMGISPAVRIDERRHQRQLERHHQSELAQKQQEGRRKQPPNGSGR